MRNFSKWLSGFRDSIADYGYYIDFEKVHRNVNDIKVELNILNSLIGSKDICFDFEEIMPRPELLANKEVKNINLQALLTRINERITEKYDRDHQISHSYLMGVET